MKKAEHLTEEQFNRYRHRTLAPAELLNVDRHIAQCEACLARLWREADALSPLQGLRSQLSEHLDYEQIVACAEGAFSEPYERHLAECELCRAEVGVLRDFRAQLSAPRRSAAVIAMPSPRQVATHFHPRRDRRRCGARRRPRLLGFAKAAAAPARLGTLENEPNSRTGAFIRTAGDASIGDRLAKTRAGAGAPQPDHQA